LRSSQQETNDARYVTIPRCLVFITHQDNLLLLRGAPNKRLWANKLNGVGGHIEPTEDPCSSAQREITEETGLVIDTLQLRALIHISGSQDAPGVLLFVFMAESDTEQIRSGPEGELAWFPHSHLPWDEMVDDLPELLPRLLASNQLIYGTYPHDSAGEYGPSGKMRYRFHDDSGPE